MQEWAKRVWRFLHETEWVEPENGAGVTWIELLIHFEISMGCEVSIPGRLAKDIPVDQLVAAFKKVFVREVRRSVSQQQTSMFEPGHGRGQDCSRLA